MDKFGIQTLHIFLFAFSQVGCNSFASLNHNKEGSNLISNAITIDTMNKVGMERRVNRTDNYKKLKQQLDVQGWSSEGTEKADALQFRDKIKPNFVNYAPDMEYVNNLKGLLPYHPELLIIIYGGNWCPDTHEGVPALLKVLDEAGFNSNNMEYHWVSRDKKSVDGQNTDLKIASVPWIRVFENGVLKGEIVEFPQKSWEYDLLSILK